MMKFIKNLKEVLILLLCIVISLLPQAGIFMLLNPVGFWQMFGTIILCLLLTSISFFIFAFSLMMFEKI